MRELFANPGLTALIVAVVASIPTYVGLRLAWKKDEAAQEVGIASQHSDTIENVITGQKELIEDLQEERREHRILVKDLRNEIRSLNEKIDGLQVSLNDALARITALGSKLYQPGGPV